MQQGVTQVGPVNAVDIIRYAFALAGRHAAVVFGTALILQAAVLALSFVAMNTLGMAGMAIWPLLLAAASQLSIGVYTLFLLHLRHGHAMPSPLYLLNASAHFLGPLLWLGILSSLGIMLGFICLIVPGVILSLRWAVAAPALVARRVSAVEALSISRRVTRGSYGTVFALAVIQFFIASVVPRLLGGGSTTMALENVLLLQALVGVICTPIIAIASAELFLRLARVPDRIDADAPLGGTAAPTAHGPWVPLGTPTAAAAPALPAQAAQAYGAAATIPANAYGAPATHAQPYGAPVHASPAYGHPPAAPAHMYAANAQPPVAPQPPAPPFPQAAPQPAVAPYPPAPGIAGPPVAPQRTQSVGPPGMS